MKIKMCVLALFLAPAVAPAQTNNFTARLQQGLLEEQGNRNLDAAIADYQSLAALFDKDRQVAATAVFRLGECYRAQGKTNEAAAQYQRILREFPDQNTLALMSRQNLAGIGVAEPGVRSAANWAQQEATSSLSENSDAKLWDLLARLPPERLEKVLPTLAPDPVLTSLLQNRNQAESRLAELETHDAATHPEVREQKAAVGAIDKLIRDKIDGIMQALKLRAESSTPSAPPLSDAARQKQQQLLEEQIKVVEQELQMQQAQFKLGMMNADTPLVTQEKLLELKRQLAASEGGQAVSPPVAATTDDEDQEIQRIQKMIQNSPDLVNAPNGGSSPLEVAANKGELRVATFLLDHGADVNPKQGDTPLDMAAKNAQKTMVELLLSRGADVNSRNDSGGTALDTAAQNGYQAVVEVLLAHKADVNLPDRNGNTPLSFAAQRGRMKIIQNLLAAGANPNAKITLNSGETPLIFAIRAGSPETVKVLLAAGADPNTENTIGLTPLSFAIESGSPETLKLLLAAKADPNSGKVNAPLFCAIHRKDTVSAELLLNAGANPNATADVFLLNNGLDPTHFPDDWMEPGQSPVRHLQTVAPLWLAIHGNEPSMVNLLLKFKADPNGFQVNGEPVLFRALSSPEIVQALLEAGAKIDAHDGRNWQPLEMAVWWDYVPAVELLLKRGADPNARDPEGRTALHRAVAREPSDRKMFELLLDYHADPNAQLDNGQTPLLLITTGNKSGAAEIAALLRQHGALDKAPHWDSIEVNRLSARSPATVFRQGTNDLNYRNRFTLLETILNYYPYVAPGAMLPVRDGVLTSPNGEKLGMAFPDLTRVIIVRPTPGSTNETRISVNLFDSANAIDCSKDMPLRLGDMVEIPERDHSLGDPKVWLTDDERNAILNCLKGNVQLVVHNQKAELGLSPYGDNSTIGAVLRQKTAQTLILTSSDLSRVKVRRQAPNAYGAQEWFLDCSKPQSIPDFRLRDGDVIEIPENP
jgi:ankyrin repeat protein/tetratricopeptide (TPR) repeat protein